MHRFFSIMLLVFICFPSYSQENDSNNFQPNANITDDLSVYIHTGSSRNYRIIGSILAGSPIVILDRQGDPEFVQITDAQGRTGWIEAQYISSTGTIRNALPRLQEEVSSLQQELSSLQEQYQQSRSQNNALEQQNRRLTTELDSAQNLAAELQIKVDQADNTAMIEWFTRGGILAGVCILLGILLTYIVPKKRRRGDQWM
jgi:SH3 domain protein